MKQIRYVRVLTFINDSKKNPQVLFLLCVLSMQAVVNLFGAFAPDLAFDALWYHLTLPKLYLEHHALFHIPGGLLYYSDMPKLGEMLYIPALAFSNEITANIIHFIFGILSLFAVYFLSRRFFSVFLSLLVVTIFYANLVVAWESSAAYIDLIRAFFEVMALWSFIRWFETKKLQLLILSASMGGIAITTKLLAAASVVSFVLLIMYANIIWKKSFGELARNVFIYCFVAFLIPLPWFIFSYVNTGNPFYPIFSPIFVEVHSKVFDFHLLNPLQFLSTLWTTFVTANDPISPFYLICLPFIVLFYTKVSQKQKLIYIYSLLAILQYYCLSQIEGTRLLLPYLPALSILCVFVLLQLKENKRKTSAHLYKYLITLILIISVISIGYRSAANSKYIPVVTGQETKAEFLTNHLNFSFGDFYDTDQYFATHIKQNERVLLYGFHNLYYVDFPFIDSSWVQKEDRFDYIAVQNTQIPKQFAHWKLVYTNKKTLVKLYKPPIGECSKRCTY
jgi:4-amino-4-deoxy-L-arabinose transferase-like glycosyltransferase